MKFLYKFSVFSMLFMFIVGGVDAQENLAAESYAIFEQSCLICHGENGAARESLIIEYESLIDGGYVVPGNPDDSVFYQRLIETDIAKRMPLGQPQLAPDAIETIRQWIVTGAPDWDAVLRPKSDFITTDAMLEMIENHVNSLSVRDKSFARYFSLTHLFNAGETTETLNAYRRALSKLINSLSWGRNVVKPQPIDAQQTVFYIDFRDYEWDVRNDAWTQIEQTYPYKMTFDALTQTYLREKLTTLQQEMNCEVPFVHVDWFLATASLPPLYHDILALPDTDRELEVSLEVFVAENLQNAPGKRVWRAGFNNSRVSRHNRVVERHISRYGAYWKSYDFAGSAELQNIFTHPLDFTHDGGEIIFNLPNGLQAYYLTDGEGNRLNEAPIGIVSNRAVGDPTVRNGLSCIGCHTRGMQTFEDEVRAVVERADNPSFDKQRALELYVEKTVMDGFVAEDTQRYRSALEEAGGVFGGIEPIQRLHEAFHAPLSAAHAASAVGLETERFLDRISKSATLQNLLGALVLENGVIKRDAWTSNFFDVISELNTYDIVPPPIVKPPPGASVNIPDPNLRAALEVILGKAAGEVITVEDMEKLKDLNVEEMGIRVITGLEFAVNLNSLHIRKNLISDVSPLAGLTQLTGLWLADNNISNISPLAGLADLSVLGIYGNQISNISPLSGLTNLRGLSIYNNPISNIQPLKEMKNLSWLRMSFEQSGDLSPLSELSNLESFNYWGSGGVVPDLSPLTNLAKLRFVYIRGTQLNLSPLSRVINLESFTLWCFGTPIPDLSPLVNLPNLTKIEILGGGRSDLSHLGELTGLKEIYIINSGISDISFLKNLTNLERLNLEGNNISDVSTLTGLTNLKWLKLTSNPISDFSPLAELSQNTNIILGEVVIPDPNLRAIIAEALGKGGDAIVSISAEEMATLTHLDARNYDEPRKENISNLTGLEFAVNLSFLHIGGNSVSDLLPLKGLTKLDFLDASGNSISDLSMLKGLINLRGLILTDNSISDLSPLEELTNLEALRVNSNPISNFSPITNLTTLKEIWISHSTLSDLTLFEGLINLEGIHVWDAPIKDLSPLTGLSKLRWINFGRTQVSDLAPLANLTNLRKLTFYDCQIDDLSPLGSLTELVHIKMPHNMISDISSLGGAIHLLYLELGDNDISDISPLEKLTNLETLWIGNNNITDVSALAGLTNLEELKLTNNPITDFSSLSELFEDTKIIFDIIISDPNLRVAVAEALGKDNTAAPITVGEIATLQRLNASNKNINELTGIAFAKNLTVLNISYNPLSDLSPIASLTNLRQIQFHNTEVTDLSPLASLSDLEEIDADHTRISDLGPLTGLKKLTKLDTVHSEISDLSPLTGLTNLTRLYLYDCKATDISPLKNLTKLRWLGLNHTDHISDFFPLSGLTELRHLDLSDTEISDLTPLAELVNLETLILNANRIVDVSPLASLRNLKNLQLHENNISDLSPLAGIRETIEVFTWFANPAFPKGGPNIEGPWLWLTLPVIVDRESDYLAKASNNKTTEQQVATLGASEGAVIGNRTWSVGMLEPYHPDNIPDNRKNLRRLLESQDVIVPDTYGQNFVVYGSMTFYSPRIQQTKIYIGASEGQRVYLNGNLVHEDYTYYSHGAHNVGYRTFFPVTLQKGKNVLLVRLDGFKAHYDKLSLFFGFESDTAYTVALPGVGIAFSETETDLIVGDTITLNLNTENISDLAGWQADITFDPNVLEAIKVTEGDFLKPEGEDTFFQGGTIDNTEGKITDMYSARISESGVSGTGTLLSVTFMAKAGGETDVTLENFEFISITDETIPTVHPIIAITVREYPAWDVNQDGYVNIRDLILVAKDFGSGAPANLRTDVNRDGVINIQDLIIVSQHFGDSTDAAASPVLAMDNKELMPTLVQAWIDQARAADDGSHAFQQGIANLERLLASLIPDKTALLANYPNPFNPETWIPYHLAKSAEVTLTIYAVNGAVVRILELGHQAAGIYQERSRAAYWDGKNSVGESVASGIYFYTLSSGDFTGTRRMLILK